MHQKYTPGIFEWKLNSCSFLFLEQRTFYVAKTVKNKSEHNQGQKFCTSLVELAEQRWQKIIWKINCTLGIYNFFIFTNFIKTIYYCFEELWNKLYIFTLLDCSLLNNSLVEVIFVSLDIMHFFHPNKSYLNYFLFFFYQNLHNMYTTFFQSTFVDNFIFAVLNTFSK